MRDQIRADIKYAMLGSVSSAGNSPHVSYDALREPDDMPDRVTKGQRSRPDLPIKPYIKPTTQSGDGASPFPGLAPPVA